MWGIYGEGHSLFCLCSVAQPCLTLYDPMDCCPSGSSVHGISQGFSRQEYWSCLPFPSPGDLPDPGIKPRSPALQADSLPSEPQGKPIILPTIPYCSSGNNLDLQSINNLPCLYLLDLWLYCQAQSFTLENENSCVLFNQIWYTL